MLWLAGIGMCVVPFKFSWPWKMSWQSKGALPPNHNPFTWIWWCFTFSTMVNHHWTTIWDNMFHTVSKHHRQIQAEKRPYFLGNHQNITNITACRTCPCTSFLVRWGSSMLLGLCWDLQTDPWWRCEESFKHDSLSPMEVEKIHPKWKETHIGDIPFSTEPWWWEEGYLIVRIFRKGFTTWLDWLAINCAFNKASIRHSGWRLVEEFGWIWKWREPQWVPVNHESIGDLVKRFEEKLGSIMNWLEQKKQKHIWCEQKMTSLVKQDPKSVVFFTFRESSLLQKYQATGS